MDNYQKKIKKYNTKLQSASTMAKKKLYEMKLKQYYNLIGGSATQINSALESINNILNDAKTAIDNVKNTYTKESVDSAFDSINNKLADQKKDFDDKIAKLNKQLEEKIAEISTKEESIKSLENQITQKNDEIRLKFIGLRIDATDIVSI